MLKKSLLIFLTVAIFFAGMFSVSAADVGNNTSSGTVHVPGSADPGNAYWSDRQSSTMWKVTIYAAKDDSATFNESDVTVSSPLNPLNGFSLSDDFYKFGETFWLYEGTNEAGDIHSIYEEKKVSYSKSFWFADSSKEDYANEFRSMNFPGGNLHFGMMSSDSISGRLFNVRKFNMIEGVSDNGFEPKDGNRIILPYVKNVTGNTAYNFPERYDEAISFFFCSSKKNWNAFLDFAAKAAGYTQYSQLLRKMTEEGKFSLNGRVIRDVTDVDPGRKQSYAIPGRWEPETSQVAWVLMFEPVIVFTKYLSNGFNYYAMTATDAAAAMVSGCIALTLTNGNDGYTMVSGAKNYRNVAPYSVRNELSSWAFISPFFVNLCSSVLPEYPWFGYRHFETSDYYSVGSNLLYYDRVVEIGGVGFRYQAGGKVDPVTSEEGSDESTVLVLERRFTGNAMERDFSYSIYEASWSTGGNNYHVPLDFSVLNALTTGSAAVPGESAVYSINVSGIQVSLVYEKLLDHNGSVFGKCSVTLPVHGDGRLSFRVTETGDDPVYTVTKFIDAFGISTYAKTCSFSVIEGGSYELVCESSMTGTLSITKSIRDPEGFTVSDYSDIAFVLRKADLSAIGHYTVAVDLEGNILNSRYSLVNGTIVLDKTVLYDGDGDAYEVPIPGLSGFNVNVTNGSGYKTITVNGLPDGEWTVAEYYKSIDAAENCYKTLTWFGEQSSAGFNDPVEKGYIELFKYGLTNEYGNGNANKLYFENYTSDSGFDVALEKIQPNADYKEGTYVVSSFRLINPNDYDLMKSHGITVHFFVYYYENGEQIPVLEAQKTNNVAPSKGENLVCFKWYVPYGLSGHEIFCSALVNPDRGIPETDYMNNGALIAAAVTEENRSETPDTHYERVKPVDTELISPPDDSFEYARWTMWEEQNGALVKRNFALSVSRWSSARLIPDTDVPSSGNGTVRSGHGIYIVADLNVLLFSDLPSIASNYIYTGVQSCRAYYPEFMYSEALNRFSSLETTLKNSSLTTSPSFSLRENHYSDSEKRVHFIPVWFPDGEYKVVLVYSDIWTPAGMINARVVVEITVSGDAYDGWYTRY